jgi:HK97 family phage major capsid protein
MNEELKKQITACENDPVKLFALFTSELKKELENSAGFVNQEKVLELIEEKEKARMKIDNPTQPTKTEKEIAWEWFDAARHKDHNAVGNIIKTYPQYFGSVTKDITAASGGAYTVPTLIYNTIIKTVNERYWHRQRCTVIPVGSGLMTIPVEGTSVTAEWVAEITAATEGAPTTGGVAVSTYEAHAWTEVSNKWIETSTADAIDFVAYLLGVAIAKLEFTAFASGTGTSQWKGLNAETITEVSLGLIDYDGLVDMWTGIKEDDRADAVWICNDTVLAKVLKAKDGIGRPYVDPTVQRLFGKEILTNSNFGNTQMYFGNPKTYYICDQRNYTLDITAEGETCKSKRCTYVGAHCDSDGNLTRTAAFVEGVNIATE